MGFLSTLKEITVLGIEAIGETMKERKEEILRYKELYQDYDSELLRRMYDHSSGTKKIACASLLRERGYGTE